MNLQKLFEAQAELDEHIEKKHPRKEGEDRLSKKILALQVELAECAQESRCFKYWSNDQEPRIRVYDKQKSRIDKTVWKNPLLEEFVDCLHFILSIGNQIEFDQEIDDRYISDSITRQFNFIFEDVSKLMKSIRMRNPKDDLKAWYEMIIEGIIGLGEMLGFTWEQIEESYFEKNRLNHERQNNGY